MKLKIVIKIHMDCEKCRNKALKTAAEVKGVTSVSLDGDDKDRVVVTGDNVNTICVANQLQKKFHQVTILSVEEVKKKPKEKKEEKKKECCAAIVCFPAAPPPQCTKQCERKCEHCTKCQTPKCQCKCVMICTKQCERKCEHCTKCQTPKCQCKCAHTCGKCHSKSCDGNNCVIICFKCQSPKCSGQCSSSPCKPPHPPQPPCNIQCPPWCTCIKCYVPYCPPPLPCNYRIVYESGPDNCSIM